EFAGAAKDPLQRVTCGLACCDSRPTGAIEQAIGVFTSRAVTRDLRLAAVRILQRASGDLSAEEARGTVWEGYSLRCTNAALDQKDRVRKALLPSFPTDDPTLDREILRTLALLEADDVGLLSRVAERLTTISDPVDDVHHLIVLARLRAPRSDAI